MYATQYRNFAHSHLVECRWLREKIEKGKAKPENKLKILDCTFLPVPKPNPDEFENEYFGEFEKLIERPSKYKEEYEDEHIPDAIFFDLQGAMVPGNQVRLILYERNLLNKYLQLIGIGPEDHLVLYDRSDLYDCCGMLFAGKAWWLLKNHGYETVSILNGGLQEWKRLGFETTDLITQFPPVTTAIEEPPEESLIITLEEIFFEENELGEKMIDKQRKTNFVDARPKDQFLGEVKLPFPETVEGSRLSAAMNMPVGNFFNDGKLLSRDEIEEMVKSKQKFQAENLTICMCTFGIQASLLCFILDYLDIGLKIKVFNGSLYEVSCRVPEFLDTRGPEEEEE